MPRLGLRKWYQDLALEGTVVGDQKRNEFLNDLESVLGDVRSIWLPGRLNTTTTTDASRFAYAWTYDATIATRFAVLGSGASVDFNGTTQEADTPDNDRYSFGNSAVDQPFSIVALVNPDTVNAVRTIVAKWDETTATPLREWWFYMDATGFPSLELWDESADGQIGREDQIALTASTWVLLGATYDGSSANTGIQLYKNASRVDDTNVSSGTYTAMENSATLPTLAFHIGAAATEEFWDGRMGLVALTAKVLSVDEWWEIKELCNGFFDLSL